MRFWRRHRHGWVPWPGRPGAEFCMGCPQWRQVYPVIKAGTCPCGGLTVEREAGVWVCMLCGQGYAGDAGRATRIELQSEHLPLRED